MSHNYRKVVNRGDTVTEIPLDWLLRWDAATSDGISYLTDAATNDVDEWVSQQGPEALGTLTMLDVGVAANYPEYIRDTDGLPCVHCQDDGALWVSNILASNPAIHARIDDATDVTVLVVSKFLDPANETSGNAYCFRGINNFAVGTVGLDDSLDLYTNAAFTAATNGFDNRRFIASMRNVHNGADDNDTDGWVGKTNIISRTSQTDASVAGPNTITVGSWGASSSTWDSDCNIYEVLIYGRSLSDAEHATAVDYLSYKWQTTNADNSNDIISGPFPNDFAARWDSTTSAGMTFNTDEPTGDIASWVDETGNYTLDQTRTNYPIWTPGAVAFSAAMGLVEATTDFDATNMTLFVAASYDGVSGYDYMVIAPNETSIGNQGGTDEKIAFVTDNTGTTIYKSTNDLTDTAMVLGVTNTHVGTNDNDKVPYVGTTALTAHNTVSDANSSFGQLNVGWYIDDARCVEGDFYEMLIWSRVLTTDEIADVVEYLSKKWQAGNEDAASPGITSSTGRTWVSDYVDPQGEALANYTPINHRIESFPNDPSDPLRGSNKREPYSRFPSSLPNLQCWYRSDNTSTMTFATGDALAGGTVSSWTDITGNYTANTATSGDSDVTFHPGGAVRGGFPSVEGGAAAGTPRSLENTSNVLLNNDSGQQRLYWSVGTYGNAALNSSWGGPHSNIVFGGTQAAMATDMVAKPAISYVGSLSAGWAMNYGIANAGPPADNGDIHIYVWRLTDTGAIAGVESWYAGLKLPDRSSSTADGDPRLAIGALATTNFDAEGAQMLEMGIAASLTATVQEYTDAHVEQLIRYLCDRYNVDYMPATTPITIGCWSRQTTSNALTDCCLWHDPSTIGAGRWPLHPDVAQYHTTPANFDMETGADATSVAMTLSSGELGFQTVSADENVIAHQHMEAANAYVSTETTDYPADTLGMSTFVLCKIDSATTTGSGARCGTAIAQLRNLSTTTVQVYGGAMPITFTSSTDKWAIVGTSYAYDDDGTGGEGYPGSVVGNPGCYYYLNDAPMQSDSDFSDGSFSVENWVNWDIADGVVSALEFITYKHPMTIEEIDELRKYFIYKYRRNFDFVNIQPHNVDEDTVAHWSFAGNALDDLGNKAAFNTGSYSAGTTPRPYQYACHDHTASTGFSYSAQDADLDTLGPFTFGAALYLDSLPTGGNWRPVVRSSPPSGGTGLNNNHRYTLRIMDDGTLQYQHQYGNKQNVSFTTTMTVPVGEWFYLGLSRADDGLSVNLIMNDTIEVLSGFVNEPENGSLARFELFESWDGDDFLGDAFSVIFKNVYTTTGGLHAMKKQVFKEGG
jgi:hypothetical protein